MTAPGVPPRPAVMMDNGHFSDSDSSLDGGGSDESQLYAAAAAVAGPGAAAAGGAAAVGGSRRSEAGRRRRSGGIPSLISRHGSRSNLGVENGISRAHEISRCGHRCTDPYPRDSSNQ